MGKQEDLNKIILVTKTEGNEQSTHVLVEEMF